MEKVLTVHGTPDSGYDVEWVHDGEVVRYQHLDVKPQHTWFIRLREKGYHVIDVSHP
jgi:hypothetical protein